MFKLIFSLIATSLIALVPLSYAQDEMSAEDKAWMEYMTPGSLHELMANSVGEWKTTNTFWMTPEAEPMVSEGTSTVEMIMGGRYQKATHKGVMMGMPFEGMSLQGYDNETEEFIAVWIDNFGTGISVSRGTYDEETKTITYVGSMINPVDGKELKYRQTYQIIDDNNHVFEMFILQDGGEFKTMNLEYSR